MYEFEEKIVEISKLKPSPVKVTLQTEKLFMDVTGIAKAHPEQIEPITVAVLGDLQYIVNGHLRAKALEAAGRGSAKAHLVPVNEIADVVRLHIELNTHGSINPLKMLDAVRFLAKYDAAQSIPKRYQELAKKNLHPKVRKKWEEFLAGACRRYQTVELPIHVIERIAQFESEKEQMTTTTVITDSLTDVKERKFVFPAPADLEMILLTIAPRDHEKKVTVFEPKKDGWPKMNKKEAEEIVRGSPHDSIVQCECGNRLLLNTKTRQVARVTDDAKNRCIKLEESSPGRPVYGIPPAMVKFLEVQSEDSLRFLKIRSKRELERFAGTIKDDLPLRLVIIYR